MIRRLSILTKFVIQEFILFVEHSITNLPAQSHYFQESDISSMSYFRYFSFVM